MDLNKKKKNKKNFFCLLSTIEKNLIYGFIGVGLLQLPRE